MILNEFLVVVFSYFAVGIKGTGFSIDKKILKEFMGWAKYVIPASIITLLLMQFDKVILGKTLSPEELGLYFVAFNFAAAVSTLTIEYARGVLYPYLSIVYRENPEGYLDKYYQKKFKVCVFLAFATGGLAGCSFLFFDILYDDRYLQAGFYLQLLLVTPILTLVTYSSELSLILYGRLKATVDANVIRLLWYLSSTRVSYHFLVC